MKIVSSQAMARIDTRTQAEFAVPSTILMEDAGLKAWAAARRLLAGGRPLRGPLVFVAGKGNNGGDAFVMARQAAQERPARAALSVLLAAGEPATGTDPAVMLAMCRALGIECLDWVRDGETARRRIAAASWIVDGISGTGLRGALRPPLAEAAAAINGSPAATIAIDLPSGLGDEYAPGFPAVKADLTLTMGLPKKCLYLPHARALAGRICVVPVGFPAALADDPGIPGELLPRGAWRRLAPVIPMDTYKNRRGHLAVFAGSPGTTGAAWLCATAAARSRLGLVTLFAETAVYPLLAAKLTSVMCRPWDAPLEPGAAGWDPAGFTGVLAGPGWGVTPEKERWLERLVSARHVGRGAEPLSGVIDADGLGLLGRLREAGKVDLGGRWVLTPHPGEFSRLTGTPREAVLADPFARALEAAAALNAVVVLKGHCTVIASPGGRYWVFDGANPAMATGGSGDVLAGIIAAGIAGGLAPLDAALFGVSLHGAAGRRAARRTGWFLAEDLVPLLSSLLGR